MFQRILVRIIQLNTTADFLNQNELGVWELKDFCIIVMDSYFLHFALTVRSYCLNCIGSVLYPTPNFLLLRLDDQDLTTDLKK